MKNINCRVCGSFFEVEDKSTRFLCDSCKQESFKNHFKHTVQQKVLCRNKNCNNVCEVVEKKGSKAFLEKRGVRLCEDCKTGKNGYRSYNLKEREVKCERCKSLIRSESIKGTYQAKDVIYGGLCEECKRNTGTYEVIYRCRDCGEEYVVQMNIKPRTLVKHYLCEECKKIQYALRSRNLSERMKLNNPMHSREVAKKVSETMKSKYNNGELISATGVDRYNYKGNNFISNLVRSRLYGRWIYPILERDNFKCSRCDVSRNLQVHHVRPFREILEESLDSLQIDPSMKKTPIGEWNSDLLKKLVDKAVSLHDLDHGITLCKKCHSEQDYFYRPFKGSKKMRLLEMEERK